jgi:hypothetical protein
VRGEVSVPLTVLPEDLRKVSSMRDLTTGASVPFRGGSASVVLPPFGFTVLRLGSRSLPDLKPSFLARAIKRTRRRRSGCV